MNSLSLDITIQLVGAEQGDGTDTLISIDGLVKT